MIRVHAAVERNINSAVERINKFQILKYKFPVSEIQRTLYRDTGLF